MGSPAPLPDYLTTREAADLCRFKTTGAIRKAVMEKRLLPAGRRGGKGTMVFERSAVLAFYLGLPPGSVPLGPTAACPRTRRRSGRSCCPRATRPRAGEGTVDSRRLPDLWMVSRTRPELTAPSGRVFRMAGSREKGLLVIRTLFGELAKHDPTLPGTLAVAYPELPDALFAFVETAQPEGEATFGAALAQYLETLMWKITWADLGIEVRRE